MSWFYLRARILFDELRIRCVRDFCSPRASPTRQFAARSGTLAPQGLMNRRIKIHSGALRAFHRGDGGAKRHNVMTDRRAGSGVAVASSTHSHGAQGMEIGVSTGLIVLGRGARIERLQLSLMSALRDIGDAERHLGLSFSGRGIRAGMGARDRNCSARRRQSRPCRQLVMQTHGLAK